MRGLPLQAQVVEADETESRQYLDLESLGSEDLEEEFEGEKGRRSLASIFESDEEIVEVDADLQDESLLVSFPSC